MLYSWLENPLYDQHKHPCANVLAVLYALEQMGDVDAIGYVIRTTYIHHCARVRQAAVHCQSVLEQRIASQKLSRTLLRAADASDSANAHLLLPSLSTSDTPSEQLLRAELSACSAE